MCALAAFLRMAAGRHGAFARFVATSDQQFIMNHHDHEPKKGSVVRACACCGVLVLVCCVLVLWCVLHVLSCEYYVSTPK